MSAGRMKGNFGSRCRPLDFMVAVLALQCLVGDVKLQKDPDYTLRIRRDEGLVGHIENVPSRASGRSIPVHPFAFGPWMRSRNKRINGNSARRGSPQISKSILWSELVVALFGEICARLGARAVTLAECERKKRPDRVFALCPLFVIRSRERKLRMGYHIFV